MRKLEVIVLNAKDAIDACLAGADRLELVSDIEVGGLSPSIKTVEEVVSNVQIPVNVMVRCKASDFVYNESEMQEMVTYIHQIKDLGINGIVFGSLDQTFSVEVSQLETIVNACSGLEVTFHRAIDECDSKYEENIKLIDKLATNVLTSGTVHCPIEQNIERLKAISNHKVRLLVGGGINESNFTNLIESLLNVDFHIGSLAYVNRDFKQGIDRESIIRVKSKLDM